jgi:hypothetical protein
MSNSFHFISAPPLMKNTLKKKSGPGADSYEMKTIGHY